MVNAHFDSATFQHSSALGSQFVSGRNWVSASPSSRRPYSWPLCSVKGLLLLLVRSLFGDDPGAGLRLRHDSGSRERSSGNDGAVKHLRQEQGPQGRRRRGHDRVL